MTNKTIKDRCVTTVEVSKNSSLIIDRIFKIISDSNNGSDNPDTYGRLISNVFLSNIIHHLRKVPRDRDTCPDPTAFMSVVPAYTETIAYIFGDVMRLYRRSNYYAKNVDSIVIKNLMKTLKETVYELTLPFTFGELNDLMNETVEIANGLYDKLTDAQNK